jgi:hypothetical protein
VPLHLPNALAPAAAARLTYRSGPLISAVQVFTIFRGSAWKQPPLSSLIGQLNSFFDVILTGALIDQLTEYNVPGIRRGWRHLRLADEEDRDLHGAARMVEQRQPLLVNSFANESTGFPLSTAGRARLINGD